MPDQKGDYNGYQQPGLTYQQQMQEYLFQKQLLSQSPQQQFFVQRLQQQNLLGTSQDQFGYYSQNTSNTNPSSYQNPISKSEIKTLTQSQAETSNILTRQTQSYDFTCFASQASNNSIIDFNASNNQIPHDSYDYPITNVNNYLNQSDYNSNNFYPNQNFGFNSSNYDYLSSFHHSTPKRPPRDEQVVNNYYTYNNILFYLPPNFQQNQQTFSPINSCKGVPSLTNSDSNFLNIPNKHENSQTKEIFANYSRLSEDENGYIFGLNFLSLCVYMLLQLIMYANEQQLAIKLS